MLPIRFTNPRTSLLTWDPFRELNRVGHWLDGQLDESDMSSFPVDVREEATSYIVEANLPGWSKEDVQITLENNLLTITAEKTEEKTETKNDAEGEVNYHIRERRLGKISRAFSMPEDIDPAKVQATMSNGVLTVTLEKVEVEPPRRITVS